MKYLRLFQNAQASQEALANVDYLVLQKIRGVGVKLTSPSILDHYIAKVVTTTPDEQVSLVTSSSAMWQIAPERLLIDGVEQDTAQQYYEIATIGEHTVEYYTDSEGHSSEVVNACFTTLQFTSMIIPDYVTTIGSQAFSGCSSLESVVIPSGVTTIGDRAFDGCSALTSIIIPSGVTSIGQYAFDDCRALTSITCLATVPPTLGENTFYNTNDCPIYVPAASVNAYKEANGWIDYALRIQAIQ